MNNRSLARLLSLSLAVLLAVLGVALILSQAPGAAAASYPLAQPSHAVSTPLAVESTPPDNRVRLLESNDRKIVLELAAPELHIESQIVEGQPCQTVHAEGFGEIGPAGSYQLPARGIMLGIPSHIVPLIQVVAAEVATLPGSFKLCQQADPVYQLDPNGEVQYLGERIENTAQIYSSEGFTPTLPVALVSSGFIRSQRIAQLRFQPYQYNPASGELRVYRSLRVELNWEGNAGRSSERIDEGPFEALLQNVLLNYETARAWRLQATQPAPGQASLPAPNLPAYKVSVAQDGLHRLDYAELLAAGLPLGEINPQTFQLYNQGLETAIYIPGEGDGAFDPGDFILFYGQKTNTRFTDTNVYWLTWGNGVGRRMAVLNGAPSGVLPRPDLYTTTLLLEENHYYQPARPSGPELDRWYWDYIYATSIVTKTYEFTLQGVAGLAPLEPLTLTLRGVFRGYLATPQHHTRVLLNGRLVEDAFWPSEAEHDFEVRLPQADLNEGQNTLQVVCPLGNGITLDYLFINRFEIEYAHLYQASNDLLDFGTGAGGFLQFQVGGFTSSTLYLFDITDPFTPRRVIDFDLQPGAGGYKLTFQQAGSQERRYLSLSPAHWLSPASIVADTPSDLRSAANAADYLLITHGDFYSEVLPLAERRASRGLRVKVIDVQDVYDEFSAGVFDPHAIRDFIAYAYANWQPPAPAYVLLVGDGNYDFKNFYQRGEPNYLPPYLADVDPWLLETASDNRFVTVVGDDFLPDLFVGRLPVKTRSEAGGMVTKILDYEQAPAITDWNQDMLFVADNADQAGDFAAISDKAANLLPAPYSAQKVYYGVTHPTAAGARAAILAAINQGRLLVNYAGHANIQEWASEDLLTLNSIAGLANGERLPLIVSMTCLDGYFIHPSPPGKEYSSLGESIARAAFKGAVASWSPAGLGLSYGHQYLDQALFQALFSDDLARLGPATTQARLVLYATTGSYQELIDTYVLFGDPATRLNTLPADVGISLTAKPASPVTPGDPVTYTLVFSNAGPAAAHHVLITDRLAPELINPTVISAGVAITPVAGSRLAWQAVDLAAGQGGIITITAFTPPEPIYPFTNTAIIATSAYETHTANNLAGPVTLTVTLPDLAIHKQGPAAAAPSEWVTYTLSFANAGSFNASQVVISDALPAALLSPTASWSGAALTLRPGAAFVWDAAQLTPGAGGVITITAQIKPTYRGALTNTVTITCSGRELSTANNTAAQTIQVSQPPPRFRLYLPLVIRAP